MSDKAQNPLPGVTLTQAVEATRSHPCQVFADSLRQLAQPSEGVYTDANEQLASVIWLSSFYPTTNK